jgi:hypothetical protein
MASGFLRGAVHGSERRMTKLRALCAGHVAAGRAALATRAARVELTLAPGGEASARFFRRLGSALDSVLRQRDASLTLSIEALAGREVHHLERMLGRLARHGDRVSVVLHERLRTRVRVDSSRLTLVLQPQP